MRVSIRRKDAKLFWVEHGGKYVVQTTYDEDADTRLQLRIRYDAPDRTYFVDKIRFDATKDLDTLFIDLEKELCFDLPKPTQCTFTPAPWKEGDEIRITTQEMRLYNTVTKEPFRRRSFSIELEEGIWKSGEVLSLMDVRREQVWEQLRQMRDLPDLS
jgi:hypothetical protein